LVGSGFWAFFLGSGGGLVFLGGGLLFFLAWWVFFLFFGGGGFGVAVVVLGFCGPEVTLASPPLPDFARRTR